MSQPALNLSFRFLFRQDEGRIGRQIWWAGTLGLALVLAILSDIWFYISDGAFRTLDNTPLLDARTLFTYMYLVFFALAILLIGVCHYMLSAKRWRDRGRPPALAGLLPLTALLTGAVNWLAPRVGDAMPAWGPHAMDGLFLAMLAWVVAELGVIDARAPE